MYEDAFCVSPNAWGGVLNVDTIPRIRAQVVCGACNNQLQFASDAALMAQVCFVPIICAKVRTRRGGLLYWPARRSLRARFCVQPHGRCQLQHGGKATLFTSFTYILLTPSVLSFRFTATSLAIPCWSSTSTLQILTPYPAP
jgi:hypothetical protein